MSIFQNQSLVLEIEERLDRLSQRVKSFSANGVYDPAKFLEPFAARLLNLIYDWHLTDPNPGVPNTKAIDLVDITNKVAVQVSIQESSEKLRHTKAMLKDGKLADYEAIVVFFLHHRKYRNNSGLRVINIGTLIGDLMGRPVPFLKQIADLLDEELGKEPTSQRPWHIPRAAVRFFGRASEIDEIVKLFREHSRVGILGPGGIGKTALASAVVGHLAESRGGPSHFSAGAYSHDYYYQPDAQSALSSILAQAGKLSVAQPDREATVKQVLDNPNVLLYLEGCEKAECINALLNLAAQAKVLLTSRDKDKIGDACPYEVKALEPHTATEMLLYCGGREDLIGTPEATEDWRTLAERLGCHPLALRLAGAWLRKRKEEVAGFLRRLESNGLSFWDRKKEPKENLSVLFQHTANVVKQRDPEALVAWYALALPGHAFAPAGSVAAALGIEIAKAEDILGALGDYSVAEGRAAETERVWQLSHALLVEWGFSKEGLGSIVPAETLAKARNGWLRWWCEKLHKSYGNGKPIADSTHAFLDSLPADAIWRELLKALPSGLTEFNRGFGAIDDWRAQEFYVPWEVFFGRLYWGVCTYLFGKEHAETLRAMQSVCEALDSPYGDSSAGDLYRVLVERQERVLGLDNPESQRAIQALTRIEEEEERCRIAEGIAINRAESAG